MRLSRLSISVAGAPLTSVYFCRGCASHPVPVRVPRAAPGHAATQVLILIMATQVLILIMATQVLILIMATQVLILIMATQVLILIMATGVNTDNDKFIEITMSPVCEENSRPHAYNAINVDEDPDSPNIRCR